MDAIIVTVPANIRYLTGFSGSACVLIVTGSGSVACTDSRYAVQIEEELREAGLGGEVKVVVGNLKEQESAIVAAVRKAGALRVGLEAEHVSWAAKEKWAKSVAGAASAGGAGCDVVATTELVERLRRCKDRGELARLERAASIADEALLSTAGMLADGPTESEVALELETAMRRLGAEDRSFDTIVASGPNGAKPHARPSDRRISPGETVVIDFGATFDGYHSDMTRTLCPGGELHGQMAEVYKVVLEAQAAGLAAAGPGVAAKDVDEACRDVIKAAGYGDAFGHGTGHGVGLEVHEAPVVGPRSDDTLEEGHAVTVEPGIYLPGIGGVRIEDMVVVGPAGTRVVTGYTKEIWR